MEKFYEINNIKVILFSKLQNNNGVDGYYGITSKVKQLFYVKDGTMTDIFMDKYIRDIYDDGNMPEFYYNPVNYLSLSMYTKSELKSGLVSEDRLLNIYFELNSDYISYKNIKDEECGIYDFNKYSKVRRREE